MSGALPPLVDGPRIVYRDALAYYRSRERLCKFLRARLSAWVGRQQAGGFRYLESGLNWQDDFDGHGKALHNLLKEALLEHLLGDDLRVDSTATPAKRGAADAAEAAGCAQSGYVVAEEAGDDASTMSDDVAQIGYAVAMTTSESLEPDAPMSKAARKRRAQKLRKQQDASGADASKGAAAAEWFRDRPGPTKKQLEDWAERTGHAILRGLGAALRAMGPIVIAELGKKTGNPRQVVWARFVYRMIVGQLEDEEDSYNVGLLCDMRFFRCGECAKETSATMTSFSEVCDETKLWCDDCADYRAPTGAIRCVDLGLQVEKALRKANNCPYMCGRALTVSGLRPLHELLLLDPNAKEEAQALPHDAGLLWSDDPPAAPGMTLAEVESLIEENQKVLEAKIDAAFAKIDASCPKCGGPRKLKKGGPGGGKAKGGGKGAKKGFEKRRGGN